MRGVTHGGKFQLDELLAYLILRYLFPGLQLTRSSDPDVIRLADIVWDIGGVYDHLRRRYDHHQPEGREARRRKNGVPRAALGLIWLHYGVEFCETFAKKFGVKSERLAEQLDLNLIQGLDAADSGERDGGFTLAGCVEVELQIPTWTEDVEAANPQPLVEACTDADYDVAFYRAGEMIWAKFEDRIKLEAAKIRAEELVEAANPDGQILVLSANCVWQDVVSSKYLNVQFVVFPISPALWAVQAVPVKPGSQLLRRRLPDVWAGLSGPPLQKATTVADAIRVGSGFRGTAASENGAVRMAELALQMN